jgi:4-amino-4-deoxy-L-arabinose transferase-like glycosyltransferase
VSLPATVQMHAGIRWPGVLLLLALTPLWLVGLFGRGLWTPDEPREADIAWRMSMQSDRALPHLAGTLFLEKPPFTYWMSAAALSRLGDSPAAARAPNLLYALIAALAIGLLARDMLRNPQMALVAALVAMSALLTFRVSVWLAPDAALLAGCALALLGAWLGYVAPPGRRKAGGYALMHLGAALGFLAKSAPGWLVPGIALLCLIFWERRWSELRRWELYAGFALQVLLIGPWVIAVLRTPEGADALRALFWNNTVGRFTKVAGPAALDYTTGHRNWPGKYLVELPLYLLPWTLVVLAALIRAVAEVRTRGAQATRWRFALSASVPFLALLSLAATGRDVYAAPALLGLGLLAGLWIQAAQQEATALDRLALQATRCVVSVISWAVAVALVILAAEGTGALRSRVAAAIAIVVIAHVFMNRAARAAASHAWPRSLEWTYAAYAATMLIGLLSTSAVIDRWQNLPALAQQIKSDTAQQPLALLDPDETTIAMLDHGLATPFTVLRSGGVARAAVGAWFRANGARARVLVLLPGHAPGPLSNLTNLFQPVRPDDGPAARLVAEGGALLARRYELPQGRRYALLAPPT